MTDKPAAPAAPDAESLQPRDHPADARHSALSFAILTTLMTGELNATDLLARLDIAADGLDAELKQLIDRQSIETRVDGNTGESRWDVTATGRAEFADEFDRLQRRLDEAG